MVPLEFNRKFTKKEGHEQFDQACELERPDDISIQIWSEIEHQSHATERRNPTGAYPDRGTSANKKQVDDPYTNIIASLPDNNFAG